MIYLLTLWFLLLFLNVLIQRTRDVHYDVQGRSGQLSSNSVSLRIYQKISHTFRI